MNITDIKIRKLFPTGRLKALVSLTVGGDLAVHDIKVIDGPERTFVAMPSRREEDGRYRDIIHPISLAARQQLESCILEAYRQKLEEEQAGAPAGGLSGEAASGAAEPAADGDEPRPS